MPFDPYYDDYSHPSRHLRWCMCAGCREMWGGRRRQGLPERKSGGPRDPSQRRIAKFNYKCQRPDEYLESWQVDLPVNPRHARWARRRRKERHSQ